MKPGQVVDMERAVAGVMVNGITEIWGLQQLLERNRERIRNGNEARAVFAVGTRDQVTAHARSLKRRMGK